MVLLPPAWLGGSNVDDGPERALYTTRSPLRA
jgi:hypothetical protein